MLDYIHLNAARGRLVRVEAKEWIASRIVPSFSLRMSRTDPPATDRPVAATWAAIFDWDGVIIDSRQHHEESWERLAREVRRPLPEGHFLRGFGRKNEFIFLKFSSGRSCRRRLISFLCAKRRCTARSSRSEA